MRIRNMILLLSAIAMAASGCCCLKPKSAGTETTGPRFEVYPIGYVRVAEGHTTIELDKKFEPGLLNLDKHEYVNVFYWFDRNDTPEKRAILRVHPRGDENNPLSGVFATHSPVRPNLIALTRCRILSIKGNVIEIDAIDAFPNTPVLDLKP